MTTGTTPRIIDSRYILDDDCREGGMARVYRAIDRRDHSTVAVKILARELNQDERLLNRVFDGERRSLERLKHPNIVELLDGGRDQATREPYFVFEWIERNLTEALAIAPCSSWDDFATRFGIPLLEALAHAHERQIQHRDIKPANILVTETGVPKVSDFGIAKIQSDILPGLTLADHVTRPYVPPRGEHSASRDVYAYAVMALTILAGIDPLDDAYAADRYVAVEEALDKAPIPERVRDLLAGCVSADPDDRPSSAGFLLSRLAAIQETRLRRTLPAKNYYLTLTPRARDDILKSLLLSEASQVVPAVNEDLAEGCAIAPLVIDGEVQEGRYEIYGAELRLRVALDTAADRLMVVGVRALPSSLLEKRRERAYAARFAFVVGDPPDRTRARDDLLDLQVAILDYIDEADARLRAEEERRIFWTWKSTLNAKQQLEREREAPVQFTSAEVDRRRVTFQLAQPAANDLLGENRFRQVELPGGGYLGGEIYDVRGSEVDFAVRYGDPGRIPFTGSLKVDTKASRAAIARQSAALDALLYDRALRPELSKLLARPEQAAVPRAVEEPEFVHADLDQPKREAVRKALGCEDLLLVQGPPGTGKTTFITETVIQFLRLNPDARVLVTSQTHAALDNVIENLAGLGQGLRLVRVARSDDPRVSPDVSDLLIDTVVTRWREEVVSRGRDFLRHWAETNGISARDVEIATLYEEAAGVVGEAEALAIEQQSRATELEALHGRADDVSTRDRGATTQLRLDEIESEIASLHDQLDAVKRRLIQMKAVQAKELDVLTAHELRQRAEAAVDTDNEAFTQCQALVRLLGDWHSRFGVGDEFHGAALVNAQVIAATCLGLQSFRGADAVEFDLCVVDEASKATATEVLVPMVQARRWILVGDRMQLPPFVEDALLRKDILSEHELNERDVRETLLDRLEQRLPAAARTVLSTQHRMVPEIGDLISACFYEGKLRSAEGQRSPWLAHVFEKPVVWYTTSRQGGRFETAVGTSRSNNLEARQVRDLLDRLNFAATHAGETLSVAVLSGYLAQLTTIERQIADRRDGWSSLNVYCSSIDAFQGRQCDVLMYSVTRSNPDGKLGFLREERRLNVALSRGRQGLVLVGDHLFARSAGDVGNPFRDVIDFIDEHPSSCALVEVEA